MSRIVSFRGKLADDQIERISLGTIRGETGYQITKFELFPNDPAGNNQQSLVQIWKEVVGSAPFQLVDFSENRLLGAGYQENDNSGATPLVIATVIFDNEIFNQDIFVTAYVEGSDVTDFINYYIELEQIDLQLDEATVATLKDIRNTGSQ
jgi:hypothetical protein